MQYRMDKIVEAKITKYLDGDTIKVTLTNGFIITVRLLLIDCPEYKRLKIDQQLYGYEALEYAKEKLKIGDIVYLEFEGEVIKDKYDRHLAYLCTQRKYLNRLLSAQDEARLKKLNIWSIEGYVINNSFDMNVVGNNSDIVYISKSNQSKIYHKFKDIHNLKNTKAITLFEAKKLRYNYCKKCFKKGI